MSGYIYFVQACRSGLVKIGRATHFSARLSAIRSQSPEPIRVLGVMVADFPAEAEAVIHERFRDLHHHGEWFRPSAEMLGMINRHCAVPEDEWSPTFCQIIQKARAFGHLFANVAA